MSSRIQCPHCGAKRGLATYQDGTWCYSCHTKTKNKNLVLKLKKETTSVSPLAPSDANAPLPDDVVKWLLQYGLTGEHIKKFGIYWSLDNSRLIFPKFKDNKLVSAWMRSLIRQPKWMLYGEKDLFVLRKGSERTESVVVVEDIVSAIRCSDYMDAICLGGTNTAHNSLLPTLLKYKTVIGWFDGDHAGRIASKSFVKYYQIHRQIRIVKTTKDPKEHTNDEMKIILNKPWVAYESY